MAEKRVIEQTASSEIYNDDWFLKDSVLEGTTKISAENLAKGLIDNVDASDIAYDNSESGLTATNVQDAIDETFENAGKVDDVKVDGTSVVTNKVAEIEIPVKDVQVKTDSIYDSVVDASGNAKIDLSSVTAYGEVSNLPQAIATFKDGADAPLKELKVAIEPQQEGSGDPSPTNIRPIIGWDEVDVTRTGKNHFDKTTVTVKKFLTSDGRIETSANWSISDYIGAKGGTAYILSGVTNAGTVAYHCFYDKDKNFISSVISTTQNFTTPSNAVYVRLSMRTETPDAVQLELGNTATEYHAYNGHTYTIDLDGTRYGGTLDVVSGELTVDKKYVDLGSLTWTTAGSGRHNTSISDGKFALINQETANAISSQYVVTSANDIPNINLSFCYGVNSVDTLQVNDSRYNGEDATDFKTHMNGVQLVYELATPLIIQLTPTAVKSLLGQNNIWADTGDINKCVYRRDMSSTIDDIIARLEALEG